MSTDPWSLSRTAASNTTIGGVSAAEGILPANLNNIDRALGAGLAEVVYVMCGAITSAGTADAQTVTTSLSWASLAAGKMVAFKAGSGLTNTGAATLNVDGLGATAIQDNAGSALSAGMITAAGIYLCAYDATASVWRLLNPTTSAATSVTAAAVLTDNALVRGDGGSRGAQTSVVLVDDTTGTLYLTTGDSGALGKTTAGWSDLHLATGAVINFANGDVTITHSAGLLTIGQALTVTGALSAGAITGTSTFSIGTSNAATVGTIELGHATDTTLARSAAGAVTIEGVAVKTAGKETIWIPAGAMKARTTNGAASGTAEMSTNKNMFVTLDFDTTTQEFAQFEIHLPKSWNLGTVTFQPLWSHASTTTNFGVVWGLAGVARSDDDAGDVAFGTAQTSTDTGGTTNDIYIGPESSAITIAGTPAAGDTVQFQLNRTVSDGSDTMAIDARLHGIRLFYTTSAANDS